MFFRKKGAKPTIEKDVIVIGSGGAGLVAAILAHDHGASVAILEKTARVGGTTAVSGGVVWVPNNHHMSEVGIPDSRQEALAYITRLADGRSDATLLSAFLDAAPEMARYLESHTSLKFSALGRYPDYHPEFTGGKPGGRSLDAGLFDSNELGDNKKLLRRSPIFGATAMSVAEATEWGVFSKPLKLPFALLGERLKKGFVCYGAALVGRLYKAVIEREIPILFEARAHDLVLDEGRISGVKGTHAGAEMYAVARRGVVLASGGFEWNAKLVSQFLGGPITHPNSPPASEGDGLKMAMSVGADLANMSEAWWCPSMVIPGEEYDGRSLHRGDFSTRSLPHSIIVNRAGRRFVNEAHNYNDLMKAFFTFDPVAYERPNLPAWAIVSRDYLTKYMLMTFIPGRELPDFIPRADTLAALATKVGIDPAGLTATVERFNQFAAAGTDPDFQRGASLYDHFYGDPENHPNPNLGALTSPPFHAIQIHPGAIGTKGGPRIDSDARVLSVEGAPIPGLYAAGNVAQGVTGAGYPGAGSTIAAAMTFGYLAGRHVARK